MADSPGRRSPRDSILLSLLVAALATVPASCGDGGKDAEEPARATVTGEVTSTAGAPLAGVQVTRVGGTESGVTGAGGGVTLTLPVGTELVLRLTRTGYLDRLEPLTLPAGATSAAFGAVLLPREPAIPIAAIEAGGTATGKHGTRVTFPAGALVTAGGQAVSGAVAVTLTPIDVASGEAQAFPGAYQGLPQGGSRGPIVSFGAADFEVTQGGARLGFAPGATATVEIPLYVTLNQDGSPVAVGQHVPLWSLDPQTGVWRQEGEAEVVASAASPTGLSGRATVSHFTPWNLDQLASYPGSYQGTPVKCVIGASGDLPQRDLPAGTLCAVTYTVGDGATPIQVRTEFLPPEGNSGPLPAGVPMRLDGRANVAGALLRGVLQVTLAAGGSGPLVIVLDPANAPPTAAAGPDQTVTEGATVRLDGSGSRDPDGDPLTFAWTITSLPAGSAAALTGATTGAPTFVADRVGAYVVQLVVHDGKVASAPDTVRVMALPVPTLSIGDAQVVEGDAATSSLVFQVTLSRAAAAPVTADYATADGTATSPADYQAGAGTLTIPAGATTASVTVSVVGDTAVEPDETLTVGLSNVTGALVGDGQATGTIVNDDELPVVSIAATDAGASEAGPEPGTFTVSRSGSTATALTVLIDVTGTATNGTDYLAIPASVTILAGAASATVTVTPVADASAEGAETVVLTLVADAAYTIGTPAAATVTIVEASATLVTVKATRPQTDETGELLGIFTVFRAGSTAADLVVAFTLGGTATEALDYFAVGSSVTIPAGQASAAVSILPFGDGEVEGTETVVLTLVDGAAYDLGAPTVATVSIFDGVVRVNEVVVVATDALAAETGPDPGTFTISRSGVIALPLEVAFTVAGTATAGDDYGALPATVTFLSGQASVELTVTPVPDLLAEGSETVVLNLVAGTGYVVGPAGSATIAIGDTPLAAVTVVASDSLAAEQGTATGAFTVARTGPTTGALVVSLDVGGSATPGADYLAIPASVTILAGEASATVTVTPVDDTETEGSETVTLTVAPGAGYAVGLPASAVVNITDDDPPVVTIHATDPDAAEAGGDPGVFTVSRTGPTTAGLRIPFSVGGTALNGTDYLTIVSEIVIPFGQASATVTVSPLADGAVEGPETVLIILGLDLTGRYDLGSPSQATVTIADASPPP